jgi:DNA-binding LacI/PurR family transcriptional regulator
LESRFYTPPLTTVRQDFHRLGELAVKKLLFLESNGVEDTDLKEDAIIIKPEVVVRDSSNKLP